MSKAQSTRFARFRAVSKFVWLYQHLAGGFYFQHSDEDLSLGTLDRKKPLQANSFGLR